MIEHSWEGDFIVGPVNLEEYLSMFCSSFFSQVDVVNKKFSYWVLRKSSSVVRHVFGSSFKKWSFLEDQLALSNWLPSKMQKWPAQEPFIALISKVNQQIPIECPLPTFMSLKDTTPMGKKSVQQGMWGSLGCFQSWWTNTSRCVHFPFKLFSEKEKWFLEIHLQSR